MFDKLTELLDDYNWELNASTKTTGWRKGAYSLSVGKCYHWNKPPVNETGIKPMLPTILMKKDDRIYNECKKLFHDFHFEMVIINKNTMAPPHKDTNNIGLSIIVGLGDYNGGDLVVEDNLTGELTNHCIYWSPMYLNGREDTHYNEAYDGTRYSVILGNSKPLYAKGLNPNNKSKLNCKCQLVKNNKPN